MNVSLLSHGLISFDRFAENVPVLSTVTSIVNIALKALIHFAKTEAKLNSKYITYLNHKSYMRCVILAIPVLGNIAIKLYDKYCAKKGAALYEKALSESTTPEESLNLLKKAASYHHLPACHALGERYLKGEGVKKDLPKAIDLLAFCAYENHTDSLALLGTCYEKGEGLKKSEIKAFNLYQAAAEKKHPQASYNLAKCYMNGIGTEIDQAKATHYLKEAAKHRIPQACYDLANCYENGTGIDHIAAKAAFYYKEAASLGHAEAKYMLACCLMDGKGIAVNEGEAAKLFQETHSLGLISATFNLALCYYKGKGVAQNCKAAVELLEKLPENTYPEASYLLGLYYKETNDHQQATRHLEAAAKAGHVKAMTAYGQWLLSLSNKENNPEAAAHYLTLATNQGNVEATYTLATLYETGKGVDKDKEKAATLYESASNSHPEAALKHAQNLFQGNHVEQDKNKAKALLISQADKNNPQANYILANYYSSKGKHEQAFYRYEKAAQAGHSLSMNKLSTCYLKGLGTKVDKQQAATWYEKSALSDDLEGKINFAKCLFDGIGRDAQQEKAHCLFESISEKDQNAEVLYYLALGYSKGLPSSKPKSDSETFKLFRTSSDQGHPEAAYQLAIFYIKGVDNAPPDFKRAETLLEQAIQGGSVEAHTELGILQLTEKLGAVNPSIPFEHFKIGHEKGSAKATHYLARCYEQGIGTDKNIDAALKLYVQAANQKILEAAFWLGKYYEDKHDYSKARIFYEQAGPLKSSEAKIALANLLIEGKGGDREDDKAITLLQEVLEIEPSNNTALNALALVYYEKNDLSKAKHYFLNAKQQHYPLSQAYYAKILFEEYYAANSWMLIQTEVIPLLESAKKLAENSQDPKYHKAIGIASYYLGRCHLEKIALLPLPTQAFEFLKKAAEYEIKDAYYYLGCCYMQGIGTSPLLDEATKYINLAAQAQDPKVKDIMIIQQQYMAAMARYTFPISPLKQEQGFGFTTPQQPITGDSPLLLTNGQG